ncbi:helix-turn-helix transcriptional regulator [Chryseobacterium sp. CFBP8996]|uniref:helix-turn-helix transcriptional regulator n=1 Tax=Chryseobacterium sp. CFBP8996 TaxID=3096529 RepID=UPI002A69CD75|nr:helix-turn-helix transcriptional regulator [Chryseobacterium sp. CFBP8996]MDY0929672.1 helix-turn-helix transcriptional regulator [Chryseobacterium sp. CFBP8996]
MNTSIGKRIRSYREERGFSQEELAEKLHISRSTYQRIENGEPIHGLIILKTSVLPLM